MQKLKPCPFCHHKAELLPTFPARILIRCSNCRVYMPISCADGRYTSEEVAVKKWNTRATDKTIEALVDALKVAKAYIADPRCNSHNLSPGAQVIIKKAEAALASVEEV